MGTLDPTGKGLKFKIQVYTVASTVVGILTVSVCTANEHNGFVFTIYQLDKVVLHIGEYY